MKKLFVTAFVLTALLAGTGLADVKIEAFTRISMPGGLGDMESNSKIEYQGEKQYDISNTRMVGGLVSAVAGGYRNSATITRVDRELIWDIYHGDATYHERPLAVVSYAAMGERQDSVELKAERHSRYTVVRSELTVEETGEQKDINGFPCSEHVLTYEVELREEETGELSGRKMVVDLWVTPMTDLLRQVVDEQVDYARALQEKLDFDYSPQDMERLGMNMMTAMFGIEPEDAQDKLGEVVDRLAAIEGYPIVTEVTWKVTVEEGVEPEPEVKEEKQSGGFPFPTSRGAMRGLVADKIAGEIMGQVKTPEPSEPDLLFSSYREVKSVSVAGLPASDFEVPEGYTPVSKPKK